MHHLYHPRPTHLTVRHREVPARYVPSNERRHFSFGHWAQAQGQYGVRLT